MEKLVYLIVKDLSVIYLLHRFFLFFFGKQGKSLWRFLTPENPVKEKEPVSMPETVPYNMVGKSQTVYLEEPTKEEAKAIDPAFSENLQKIPAYEEEADITDNDVDDSPDEEVLSREERFLPLDTEPDEEAVSTGMTYEQLSQALDVVQGKQPDDSGRLAVARILYEIQGSDVFDFLAAQAENEAMIEKLIKENIDSIGIPLPESTGKQRREIEEFDMDRYV
jgi:hypothetical protein